MAGLPFTEDELTKQTAEAKVIDNRTYQIIYAARRGEYAVGGFCV